MTHGGRLIARVLKAAGVDCVFTLSGGHVMGIYDGCLDEGIDIIDVRHEQAAVHAADAWARLHPGRVGVAILTAGPGVTDGVTGVANAWRANSPIVVFGGQGPFSNLRRGSLQEMDHVGVMRPITKWADACYQTERLAEYVELAIRHALSGVPGPSFLEVPMDVLHAPLPEEPPLPRLREYRVRHAAADAEIEEAIDLLAVAERPMLMAGTGVKWSEGATSLIELLDATDLPVFCNGMGRGAVPWDHPCFLNRSRKDALSRADLVVLAGTPLDFRMKFGATIPRRRQDHPTRPRRDVDRSEPGGRRRTRRQPRLDVRPAHRAARGRRSQAVVHGLARRAARARGRARGRLPQPARQRRGPDRPVAAVSRDRRRHHRRHDRDR
ncbi:MAG: thiamine pyrophosphate-binding protein [Actinomycetota bacterium]